MKNKLMDAIGQIREEYVEAAHNNTKKDHQYIWAWVGKIATAAACILLVFTLGANIFPHYDQKAVGGSPYNNNYYVDYETGEYGADYAPRATESLTKSDSNVFPEEALDSQDINLEKKLIITANARLETLQLDPLVDKLLADVKSYGGYVQSSTVKQGSGAYRKSYEATIRIPANRFEEFINGVKVSGNLISYSENVDDVTDTYMDLEARIASLTAEEERIKELYKQAANLTELMEVEERLTDIRYEIDSKQARLKTYDLLTSYSTLNIRIEETIQYTETSESFITRLGNAFSNGWQDFTRGIGDFFIDVVYNIWTILVIAVVIVVAVIVIKKRKNKK